MTRTTATRTRNLLAWPLLIHAAGRSLLCRTQMSLPGHPPPNEKHVADRLISPGPGNNDTRTHPSRGSLA